MPSQKLVRCEVRAPNARLTTRFVPLEIFGLWEHLMTSKHGFTVIDAKASLWLDMEDSSEAAYSEHRYEHVTEVSAFVYSGRDEMFARACRYFRSDECERLKDIFLAHYRVEGRLQPHVRERQGIWVYREPAVVTA
jgi:hypothetical protein